MEVNTDEVKSCQATQTHVANDRCGSAKRPLPQSILNGEIHNWYRLRLGFSDHLVADLLKEFGASKKHRVLDPFCGAGTSLVECMKQGIYSVGIDANPATLFAAAVKTTWDLSSSLVLEALDEVERSFERCLALGTLTSDPTFRYLSNNGFIERGWIETEVLFEALAVKRAIARVKYPQKYRNLLHLALISTVVEDASNVKFGPELYCAPRKKPADVLAMFVDRVETMASDIRVLARVPRGYARVLLGDSRECDKISGVPKQLDIVISSPPYPTEHDYTRNTRIELALLEFVVDRTTLQQIKRSMIRSQTKGIYTTDNDRQHVNEEALIQNLARKIELVAGKKKYGFARLYPLVVQEYFGGIVRHLRALRRMLAPNAFCAYVVGDQSSYLGIHIPTAKILATLAKNNGYEVTEIRHWRERWSTTSSHQLQENIVIFRPRRHA